MAATHQVARLMEGPEERAAAFPGDVVGEVENAHGETMNDE